MVVVNKNIIHSSTLYRHHNNKDCQYFRLYGDSFCPQTTTCNDFSPCMTVDPSGTIFRMSYLWRFIYLGAIGASSKTYGGRAGETISLLIVPGTPVHKSIGESSDENSQKSSNEWGSPFTTTVIKTIKVPNFILFWGWSWSVPDLLHVWLTFPPKCQLRYSYLLISALKVITWN